MGQWGLEWDKKSICGVPYECLVDRLVFTCPKMVNRSIPRIIVGNSLSGMCVPTLFSCKDTNPFSRLVRVDKTLS